MFEVFCAMLLSLYPQRAKVNDEKVKLFCKIYDNSFHIGCYLTLINLLPLLLNVVI
jgi:hypothetical protein